MLYQNISKELHMNYSEEVTEYMIEKYIEHPTRQTVEQLAKELDKTIKSIIGKLSREGVYRREIYKTKTGETPVTKKEIVINIAEKLNIEEEALVGLDKTPKSALKALEKGLKTSEETKETLDTMKRMLEILVKGGYVYKEGNKYELYEDVRVKCI